jgi:hypothetical protein
MCRGDAELALATGTLNSAQGRRAEDCGMRLAPKDSGYVTSRVKLRPPCPTGPCLLCTPIPESHCEHTSHTVGNVSLPILRRSQSHFP